MADRMPELGMMPVHNPPRSWIHTSPQAQGLLEHERNAGSRSGH